MRRVRPACCARAASGHAAAVLPTSVMNVRLLIRSSDGGISRVIPLKELLHGAWLAVPIPSPSMWLALSRHLRHTGWTFGSVRVSMPGSGGGCMPLSRCQWDQLDVVLWLVDLCRNRPRAHQVSREGPHQRARHRDAGTLVKRAG